jgi:hypothetical protein
VTVPMVFAQMLRPYWNAKNLAARYISLDYLFYRSPGALPKG